MGARGPTTSNLFVLVICSIGESAQSSLQRKSLGAADETEERTDDA